jgi:hypothetical protein
VQDATLEVECGLESGRTVYGVGGGAGGGESGLRVRWVSVYRQMRGKRPFTFALDMLPMPRYTRLSRRCTSVRIILSSSRFSSVRRVSMRASAGLYCWASSWLQRIISGPASRIRTIVRTGPPAEFPRNV